MGVRGLETFMERDEYRCRKIYVGKAVERYKKLTGQSAVIVVDTNSCMGSLYYSLPWLPGGQLKQFREILERLVERFRSLDVEPVFFFDGPLCEQKIPTWIKRRTESVQQILALFNIIKSGLPLQTIEDTAGIWHVDNVQEFSKDVLKSLKCRVFTSISECDEEIAKFASENNCLAVLGQDSDFLIFPGVWQYWSAKHFDYNAMTTVEYDRQRLEKRLKLPRERLPLWASLMGNDFLRYEDVHIFHEFLRDNGYKGHRAIQIACFLEAYSDYSEADILPLVGKMFKDPRVPRLLVESVASYDVNGLNASDIDLRCPEDKNWNEILQVIAEKHKKSDFPDFVFSVAVQQKYTLGDSKEDYENIELPLNQKALKTLRRKLYGIILHEKPRPKNRKHQVKELVVAGPGTVGKFESVDPIPPRAHHPGLLNLWLIRSNTNFKWDLLCSSVGSSLRKLRCIPDEYVVPALSLFYLLEEGVKIQRWEARGFVASVVTLVDYSTERLGRINLISVEPRAVHLYSLLTRSFSAIYNLNAICGFPVPAEKTCYSGYQDGVLFHEKYSEAKFGANACELCEDKERAIDNFRLMMNLIPSLKFADN